MSFFFRFSTFFNRGALTSKPYSFVARSWEFKSISTVDFFDSLGSSIRVDIRGDQIMRILPRLNESTNDEWISDKIRFCADGLRLQRVDKPLIQLCFNKFKPINWFKLIYVIFKLFTHNYTKQFKNNIFSSFRNGNIPLRFFEGVFSTFNSALSLNFIASTLFPKFINYSCLKLQANLAERQFFTSNLSLRNISKHNVLVLCGFNIRYESPVFNIRIRHSVVKKNLITFSFGSNFISSFNINFLGGVSNFVDFLNNKHWICSSLKKKKTFILFNNFFSKIIHFSPIKKELSNRGLSYGVVARYASSVQNSEVGNLMYNYSAINNLFGCNVFLGLPSLLEHKANASLLTGAFKNNINLIFAHHGDNRLKKIDIIAPTSATFEQDSALLNCEGSVQSLRAIMPPPQNVLNISESTSLILGLAQRHQVISFKQLSFFFSIFVSSVLTKDSIWSFVNKFFILVAAKTGETKISTSLLLKDFLLISLNYLETTTILDSFEFESKNNFTPKNVIVNRSTSPLFKPIENFYVQDEVSSSSLSLVSASDRLTNKKTYH